MLRVLKRQVGVRAPSSSFFCCTGAAVCDASHDSHSPFSQLPSSPGSLLRSRDIASNQRFMPQWISNPTSFANSSSATSSFKADWIVKLPFGANAAYSSAAQKEEEEASADTKPSRSVPPKTLEDFQHEEIVGPTVDRDMSPVADELRQAHTEMTEAIQKFTKGLLAVGAVHLAWGGMMFRVLDSPLSHTLMTQVCVSALVLFGLAYYSKQTLKPISFFTRLEERSRLQILTLSLQVTKTLSSFFQRGYGVALVLFVALAANLLGSLKFFF